MPQTEERVLRPYDSLIEINASIDEILENMYTGNINRAITDSLYGINARTKNAPIPVAKDSQGFVFWTRPLLNLTAANIQRSRRMVSLMDGLKLSYNTYTRLMLDPRLAMMNPKENVSPLVNNMNAFIPLLSNTCTSLSGFPEIQLSTYTSQAGLYRQQYSYADGPTNDKEKYDITCSFRSIKGHPTLYMFTMWVYYISLVYEGLLDPYADFLFDNMIDYQTRIYRVVLDESNRFVTNIGATLSSFPVNVPIGGLLDFDVNKPYNDNNSEISIRFDSNAIFFNEDLLKLEFNQAQAIAHPGIGRIILHDAVNRFNDDKVRRNSPTAIYRIPGTNFTKIPPALVMGGDDPLINNYYGFNYSLYPYIHPYTNEMEWWVEAKLDDNGEPRNGGY